MLFRTGGSAHAANTFVESLDSPVEPRGFCFVPVSGRVEGGSLMDNDSGHGRTPKKRSLVRVWEPIFLEALAETGNVSLAAKRAEIGRQTAYDRREQAPKFKEVWTEAIDVAVDTLEEEARRRAVEGTEEPIMYLGEVVTKVRKYSDTLLIFLLKAHRPKKYRETIHHAVTGEDGGPLRHLIEVKDLTDDELARIAHKD